MNTQSQRAEGHAEPPCKCRKYILKKKDLCKNRAWMLHFSKLSLHLQTSM